MTKFERKARIKAIKAAQKAARKAARAAGAPSAPVEEALNSSADAAPEAAVHAGEAGFGCSATPAPQAAGEAPAPRDPLVDTAVRAENKLEVARAALAAQADAPHVISDARARAMLARAAELADEVVTTTRATLACVPLPRLRQAYEIATAKADAGETPATRAQNRPRRGFDPVVSLVKTGLAAASLLNRILAKTHPHLGKKAA